MGCAFQFDGKKTMVCADCGQRVPVVNGIIDPAKYRAMCRVKKPRSRPPASGCQHINLWHEDEVLVLCMTCKGKQKKIKHLVCLDCGKLVQIA